MAQHSFYLNNAKLQSTFTLNVLVTSFKIKNDFMLIIEMLKTITNYFLLKCFHFRLLKNLHYI